MRTVVGRCTTSTLEDVTCRCILSRSCRLPRKVTYQIVCYYNCVLFLLILVKLGRCNLGELSGDAFSSPSGFRSTQTYPSRDATIPTQTFVTLYDGNGGKKYFRALMYMLYSLQNTFSVKSISDVLVLLWRVSEDERAFLRHCKIKTRDVQFKWLDRTRKPPPRVATFAKLEVFRLDEDQKIVFLDIDGFANHNLKALFNFPSVSAVEHESRRRNEVKYFNTGVFVLEPTRALWKKVEGCWRRGDYSSPWWGDSNLTEQELLIFCIQGELQGMPKQYNCKGMFQAIPQRCAFVHTKWWKYGESVGNNSVAGLFSKLHVQVVAEVEEVCSELKDKTHCLHFKSWFNE